MLTAYDNLEALQKIRVAQQKVKTSWKSVDLISQILDIWNHQHCKPSTQHIFNMVITKKKVLVHLLS